MGRSCVRVQDYTVLGAGSWVSRRAQSLYCGRCLHASTFLTVQWPANNLASGLDSARFVYRTRLSGHPGLHPLACLQLVATSSGRTGPGWEGVVGVTLSCNQGSRVVGFYTCFGFGDRMRAAGSGLLSAKCRTCDWVLQAIL